MTFPRLDAGFKAGQTRARQPRPEEIPPALWGFSPNFSPGGLPPQAADEFQPRETFTTLSG